MYGCESWTIKKAEQRRIDAFELWCWRRLLRVPPKGDQSWVFIGRTDAVLAASCEELTHWKRHCCWEGLGQEEKGTTDNEMAGWHH